MIPAYYATYIPGHHGARDRIGGLPTHLPQPYPSCQHCHAELTFVMQLYVDDKALFDDSWLVLQLYECDPCGRKLLLALTGGAKLNTANEGLPLPRVERQLNHMGVPYSPVEWGEQIEWQDIIWEQRNDPEPTDEVEQFWDGNEPKEEHKHLFEDKLGGCFPWCDDACLSAKQLGAIGQFSALRHTVYLFNNPQRGLYWCYY